MLVVINTNKEHASRTSFEGTAMKTNFNGGTTLVNVFPGSDGKSYSVSSDGTLDVELPAQSAAVFAVK